MIIEILVSLLSIAGFGFILWLTKIITIAHKTMQTIMEGVSIMMDSALDDDTKEAAVRKAGFSLLLASFSVFWRLLAALTVAGIPIFIADFLDLTSKDDVTALMMRVDYIIFVSLAAIILGELARRLRKDVTADSLHDLQNSQSDQFLHALAFSSPFILKAASAIEDLLCARSFHTSTKAPIFVTSLARGGTTSLLNALYDTPSLVTHTYRDMPFLTAPILWGRLSGGKKRAVKRQKRAHGDGLEIDLNTPEAFEEVVWKLLWPKHFKQDSIPLWDSKDANHKANQFLKRHMTKIIGARKIDLEDTTTEARYCSKNNANIARIPYLLEHFPGCKLVIPVRRPECHAASLMRQHQNFLKQQSEDPFVLRYMRDIGHYEFGHIHKPISFAGFTKDQYDPGDHNYWLHYWIFAFREVLKYKETCLFVFQDDLRSTPVKTMDDLCRALELDSGDVDFKTYFHDKKDEAPCEVYDPKLFDEATKLYKELRSDSYT